MPLSVPTGDAAVTWAYRSVRNPDLAMRLRRPALTAYTRGRAIWRWTPLSEDAGPQQMVLSARTQMAEGSVELRLVVETGIDAPVFREPVGEGTTLDLRHATCAAVTVVVESTAAPRVELGLVDVPMGAMLTQTSDLGGELRFCPSPQQILDDDIYPLTLQAVAFDWVIRKTYVLVLRRS